MMVLGDAVRKIRLFRVAAQVVERQTGDRKACPAARVVALLFPAQRAPSATWSERGRRLEENKPGSGSAMFLSWVRPRSVTATSAFP